MVGTFKKTLDTGKIAMFYTEKWSFDTLRLLHLSVTFSSIVPLTSSTKKHFDYFHDAAARSLSKKISDMLGSQTSVVSTWPVRRRNGAPSCNASDKAVTTFVTPGPDVLTSEKGEG